MLSKTDQQLGHPLNYFYKNDLGPGLNLPEMSRVDSVALLRLRNITFVFWDIIALHSKWFEPRSISSSYSVFVRVRVKRTVVGD